jgi:hypothetical protein
MEVQTNDPTNQSEVDDPVEGEGIGEDAKDAASEVPQVCISHHQLKVITNHSIGG